VETCCELNPVASLYDFQGLALIVDPREAFLEAIVCVKPVGLGKVGLYCQLLVQLADYRGLVVDGDSTQIGETLAPLWVVESLAVHGGLEIEVAEQPRLV
jgi:hypothetical protein